MLKSAVLWISVAAVAPARLAILQIQVVEGDGAVHAPGVRSSRPLTVQVTDESGKPVTAAAVSLQLREDAPSGTLTSGLRTDVATTDTRGRATIHTFQANRVPGRFQMRIIASKEQARAGSTTCALLALPSFTFYDGREFADTRRNLNRRIRRLHEVLRHQRRRWSFCVSCRFPD